MGWQTSLFCRSKPVAKEPGGHALSTNIGPLAVLVVVVSPLLVVVALPPAPAWPPSPPWLGMPAVPAVPVPAGSSTGVLVAQADCEMAKKGIRSAVRTNERDIRA